MVWYLVKHRENCFFISLIMFQLFPIKWHRCELKMTA